MLNTENAERTSDRQTLSQYDHTMRWTKSRKEHTDLHMFGYAVTITNHSKPASFPATEPLNPRRIGLSQRGSKVGRGIFDDVHSASPCTFVLELRLCLQRFKCKTSIEIP